MMEFYELWQENKEICLLVFRNKEAAHWKKLFQNLLKPTEIFHQEWMPSSKSLSFLALTFLSSQSCIIQFVVHVIHLRICLFAWVTNICFPVLFIHIWEPFMMELIHWQILNMFHLKELQSDPSCKEVGKVQFLLLDYCSLFLKLHLCCVTCSDEILQRYFWLSKPDLETVIRSEVSQKEKKKSYINAYIWNLEKRETNAKNKRMDSKGAGGVG